MLVFLLYHRTNIDLVIIYILANSIYIYVYVRAHKDSCVNQIVSNLVEETLQHANRVMSTL
jgi:hypothetical protein